MHPTISLFGANGEMGRYVLTPLLEKRSDLRLINRNSLPVEIEEAWTSDMIVLSVPQNAIAGLLKNIQLRPDQLVIDICSCKRDTAELISTAGGEHLSLHPMNGPHTPWTQQKWVTVGKKPNHPLADWFMELLAEKHVMQHTIASAELHDLLMSVVLGVPEMTTVFLDMLLAKLSQQRNDIQTPEVLRCTSPAFASLFTTYIHTVCSTPLWLRTELLTAVHPSFLPACREVFAELALPDVYEKMEAFMEKQIEKVRDLSVADDYPVIVRGLVTESFNVTNSLFLGDGLQKNNTLYIQKQCTEQELFDGKEKPRVGIHGIRGAFTDEAWHRFTQETLSLSEDRYEIAELIHSANVMRAVEQNEVDIGIFAFANSGSGGYLASIEAMGKWNYRLIALFTMPINMCILGHKSIEDINQLETFYGHPVALSQCRKTLAQRWPDIRVEAATDEMDTALSAKLLADGVISPTKGVFASKRAAQIYGLRILAEGVHHDPNNATAFAVIRKN